MEERSVSVLQSVCCTCLSGTRRLQRLCRLADADAVNHLYALLACDTGASEYESAWAEWAALRVCWECGALLRRVTAFVAQARTAQRALTTATASSPPPCLSRLSAVRLPGTDCVQSRRGALRGHSPDAGRKREFVDCGSWQSADADDVPLARWKGTGSQLTEVQIDDEITDDIHSGDDGKFTRQKESCEKPQNKSKARTKTNARAKKNGLSKESRSSGSKKRLYLPPTETSKEERLRNDVENLTSIDVDTRYKCAMCGDRFEQKTDLDIHNLTVHSKRQVSAGGTRAAGGLPCAECDAYFINKSQRWKHLQRHHRDGHPCGVCGKRFAFNSNRVRHEARHGARPPRVRCATCDKLVRRDLLPVHARTHDTRVAHACHLCRKTFVSVASYEHHLKYTRPHTTRDLLKYKCGTCAKGYRSRGELRDHINYQHLQTTVHQCPVCSKALATRRGVTRHVRRAHHGIQEARRDSICQQCGKTFRDGKGLREHLLIHSGEKPLRCQHCAACFRHSASLYTHRRRVHQEPARRAVLRHVTSSPSPPAPAPRTPAQVTDTTAADTTD